MGHKLSKAAFDRVLGKAAGTHLLYGPKRFSGGGRFSDTDIVRYETITSAEEIVFDEKSALPFKEALLPVSQTLFYFTEDRVTEPEPPGKGAIVFLRSCDLHAVKRLDSIYLRNGGEDYYYRRARENVTFALIGCKTAFASCFCVDMGTNRSEDYAFSVDADGGAYLVDCKSGEWESMFSGESEQELEVIPSYVTETGVRVAVPQNLDASAANASLWEEYDSRCAACGRCNFSCPSCSCYSMQDIYYTDNGKAGERRRVWASCMVDGFTDLAGGGGYRRNKGQRMRFKALHKVLDHKQRFGEYMCVGCGRCDDVCPEYISFSGIINKLGAAMGEVKSSDEK